MNTWEVEVGLRNGHCLYGTYEGPEPGASAVAARLLTDRFGNGFNSMSDQKGKSIIFFRIEDVAALDIQLRPDYK